MQIARVFVIDSAWARSSGIGRKGPSHKVRVEAGENHLLAAVGELFSNFDQIRPHEISLVDADHLGPPIEHLNDSIAPLTTSERIRISPCETISLCE